MIYLIHFHNFSFRINYIKENSEQVMGRILEYADKYFNSFIGRISDKIRKMKGLQRVELAQIAKCILISHGIFMQKELESLKITDL